MSIKYTTLTLTKKDLKKLVEEKYNCRVKNIEVSVKITGDYDIGTYKEDINYIEFLIDDRTN